MLTGSHAPSPMLQPRVITNPTGMDPLAREDTIHEMANSLSRLGAVDDEPTAPPSRPLPMHPAFLVPPRSAAAAAAGDPSSPSSHDFHDHHEHHSPSLPTSHPSPAPAHYYHYPYATAPRPTLGPEEAPPPLPPLPPSSEPPRLRPTTRAANMQHPGRRTSLASSQHTRSSSSTTSGASYMIAASPYPAPSRPLPPVPPLSNSATSPSWHATSDHSSSQEIDRFSQSSGTPSSHLSRSSSQSTRVRPPVPPRPPEHLRPGGRHVDAYAPRPLEVTYWKQLTGSDKRKMGKSNAVHHLDISASSSTVATKHGNSIVKIWSVPSGAVIKTIKISAYIEAHSRSRDFMVRSHIILSEGSQLAAIATRFGRTIEIWNWAKPKRLQTIDNADRWVAGRFESYDAGWSPLAAYRGKEGHIDLFAVTPRDKQPYAKVRTIDLHKAGLPFIPQYPELALSSTSLMLVAAAGPRTPRAGQPPPDRETLLVAWDISDYRDVSSQPHRFIRPWQHRELETAVPCDLRVYGDLIVSLWIPAGHRTVTKATATGSFDYTLAPASVPFRYVLVWDLSENSTRTYGIPNTSCCISPDCRFVAYCHVVEGRGKLAILDATSGDEVWTAGGEGNLSSLRGVGDLSRVSEMSFSSDSRLLIVGDVEGNTGVFDIQEGKI